VARVALGVGVVVAGVIALAVAGPNLGGAGRYERDGLSFVYPASWQQRDAGSVVILGTLKIPPRCGLVLVDVNCYYEQRLEPGTISVVVSGNAGGRMSSGGPIVGVKPANAANTDLVIGGMPALFSDYGGLGPDDYYSADEVFRWIITRPDDVGRGWSIEADLRGPGVAELRDQITAAVASVRIAGAEPNGGPSPMPDEILVRVGLDRLAAGYRMAYGQRDDDGTSFYDCFPREGGRQRPYRVDHAPGGPLETPLDVTCAVDLVRDGPAFAVLTLTVAWDEAPRLAAGTYVERHWLTPEGQLAGMEFAGDWPRN
jgi:hypothetical protein